MIKEDTKNTKKRNKYAEDLETTTPAETVAEKKETAENKAVEVYVDIDRLNIRRGPGKNYETTGDFTGTGVFVIDTISEGSGSKSGWGKLNDGRGWISLDFTRRK